MELPQFIQQGGLLSVDGKTDLSLAANQHLFRWPGSLLYGDLEAYAGATPETLPAPDWRYKRLNQRDGTDREAARAAAPPKAPDMSVSQLRDIFFEEGSNRQRPKQDISRPTQAAAFEQRLLRQDIYNPFLAEYPMKAIALNAESESEPFEPDHVDGAEWVLNWFSQELLNAQFLSQEVVAALGAYTAGCVLCQYLMSNAGYLRVAALSSHFEAAWATRIEDAVKAKLNLIEAEISLWASYGRSPVEQPNGNPDLILSAVDATVATIAIYQLCDLACYLQAWQRGASWATQGIREQL